MAHLKYGFPLWSPDPPPGGAPIELGDVGGHEDKPVGGRRAFRGHSRKMIGHFSGALGSSAGHLAMSSSDFRPAEDHHRAGPPGRLQPQVQVQVSGDSTDLGEQGSELGAASMPAVYDQYKTSSDTAIASDLELYVALELGYQSQWPEDLESALEYSAPPVDVSESGVGTMRFPEETPYELPQTAMELLAPPEQVHVDQGGGRNPKDHYRKNKQQTNIAHRDTSDGTSVQRERAKARWRYAMNAVRQRLRDGRIRRDAMKPTNPTEP
ncbi:hypothetical protein C8Q79DRAFT_921872 [Trametes meyenii]|nr:hypothetical protein C8Q79DRAFT_921872 [Trametes meyenii]